MYMKPSVAPPLGGVSVWLAFAEGRKSTVRKPSALSAELANDFENGCVHSPVRPKRNGGKL
jgi:hypothetical protein